jgi:hypothetical protein
MRSGLTATGIVVAIIAFGMLHTLVDAWYAGAEATSATRLVTRNAISLVFPLPISYMNRIRQVGSVTAISYANWFGGVYISEKNFLKGIYRGAEKNTDGTHFFFHWDTLKALVPFNSNESSELI